MSSTRGSERLTSPSSNLVVGAVLTSQLIAVMSVLGGSSDNHGDAGSAAIEQMWRKPDRDAANSLYFLLRFHGRSPTYREIVRRLGGDSVRVSMEGIRVAADASDLKTAIYRVTPMQLAALREPAIAFTEKGGTDSGSFVVILNATAIEDSNGYITLVDAGSAMIENVPADEFLRGWSGHVLLPRQETTMGMSHLVVLVLVALLCGCLAAKWLGSTRFRSVP